MCARLIMYRLCASAKWKHGIDAKWIWIAESANKIIWKLTGQPSEISLRLLSLILTHDSRFIDVIFAQCLLIACAAWSVIFLQSDKSNRSMLWQCCASVLEFYKGVMNEQTTKWTRLTIVPQWLIADWLAATQWQIFQEATTSLWDIFDNGTLKLTTMSIDWIQLWQNASQCNSSCSTYLDVSLKIE